MRTDIYQFFVLTICLTTDSNKSIRAFTSEIRVGVNDSRVEFPAIHTKVLAGSFYEIRI